MGRLLLRGRQLGNKGVFAERSHEMFQAGEVSAAGQENQASM